MDQEIIFLTIVGMLAVTYVPRMVPLVALASRTLPDPVVRWLSYVPAAVLSSMLFPALLLKDGRFSFAPDNYFLWAAIPAFILAWRSKSFFGTVALGMALVAVGRHFFG